jgi:amidase
VPRQEFWGYSPHADGPAEHALGLLAAAGATIVDHTDISSIDGFDFEDELVVMLAELRAEVAGYLATRAGSVPRTLEDVVAFNREHAEVELAHFGQGLFERSLLGPTVDSEEYAAARARCVRVAREDGIDALLRAHELDALVTPSYAPAFPIDLVNPEAHSPSCTSLPAMAGYPLLTVPTGIAAGLPVAVSFWGTAGSEATLVEIAGAYEAARNRDTGPLRPPGLEPFI